MAPVAVSTLAPVAVRTLALAVALTPDPVVVFTLVLVVAFTPVQAAVFTPAQAVALTRARVVGSLLVQAEGFRMAPVADAIPGRVVTAATRGIVPIPIADNAHNIESRTAAIVPSFSFLAFSLSITPALCIPAGWLAGLI